MKIIFKTEADILREIDFTQMTDEQMEVIKADFDQKVILKYELTFNEGVTVQQCHALEDISHKMISVLTITVEQ